MEAAEPDKRYFEGTRVVVPTDCFVEGRQELAPTAAPNIALHHTQSAAVILPIELVPDQEFLQTELQDYRCHNSHRLPHWVVMAFHNAGNVVPVGLQMVGTLRT